MAPLYTNSIQTYNIYIIWEHLPSQEGKHADIVEW